MTNRLLPASLAIGFALFAATAAFAFTRPPVPTQTAAPSSPSGTAAADTPDLTAFLAPYLKILRAHVRDGRVDYAGIRNEDRASLRAFVASLGRVTADSFGSDRLAFAFHVHAYNAFAILDIVEGGPMKSVRDVPDFFTRRTHRLGGALVSLDEIEHQILRKRFADPRMHFALVCGAKSCPALDPSLSAAERFEEGLDEGTRRFVADEANVAFDEKTGVLRLSKIFDWFRPDFEKAYGSIEGFLARYLPTSRAARLASRKWRIEYAEYDWCLNGE